MKKSKSQILAKNVRIDVLKMINHGHGAHIGSAFSIADIIPVLYLNVLKCNPAKPDDPNRDIFILSKGHAGATLYATLAEVGYFPKDVLWTYEDDGSLLCGHVTRHNVPGVEVSTGSLGHGASIAAGFAHAFKMDGKKNHVYCLIGDGESEEGEIWEMAMYSAHYKLDNLTIIVDSNKQQALGDVDEIMSFAKNQNQRWEAFGFDVLSIDGHNHEEIKKALLHRHKEKPVVVIANTIKGKGVSFMEGSTLWHYKNPNGDFFVNAMKELEEK